MVFRALSRNVWDYISLLLLIFNYLAFSSSLAEILNLCLANFVDGLFLRQAKDVMKAVKKRLQHRNPRIQLLCLTVFIYLFFVFFLGGKGGKAP